jgi:hypothetical protein
MLLGMFIVSGCSVTDDGYTCVWTPTACGSVKSCCDDTNCYYDLDGVKYWCDNGDCDEAAEEVAQAACEKTAVGESAADYSETRTELLESTPSRSVK